MYKAARLQINHFSVEDVITTSATIISSPVTSSQPPVPTPPAPVPAPVPAPPMITPPAPVPAPPQVGDDGDI